MMNKTINKYENCFNLIRLFAAAQVFLIHAAEAMQITVPSFVLWIFAAFPGVPVFYILSGFLLWNSLNKSDNFGGYIQRRAFRLFPELWGGVIVNAIIMLIFLGSTIKWMPFLAFQFTQATFLQFWTPDSLRSYGIGTPNGSLWTIGVMLQCYIVLWLIYFVINKLCGKDTKKRSIWMAGLLSVMIFVSYMSIYIKELLPGMIGKLYGQTFIPYIWLFLIGALLCESFDYVIHTLMRFWYVFLALMYISRWAHLGVGYSYGIINSLLLGLAIVGLAYRYPKLTIRHDISYGLYIYHMIVMNVMIELGLVGNVGYVFLAFAVSCVMAFISYITIGKQNPRNLNEYARKPTV